VRHRGFWLNWDALGQYSATATAEWLDALPWLGAPLARNFLSAGAVGDRLFSLFVFVHLGVALLMTFGLWFHIQRLPRARVVPPWPMALALSAMFVALSALAPITSGPAANVAQVPAALALDWLLLFIHPLAGALSNGGAWALVAGALALLLLLPAWPRRTSAAPVAVVDPAHCSGCRRCVDDCPYAAITMVEHPILRGQAGPRAGPGRCRALRQLRHLRRRLPVVHAVSQHGAAGQRHRPAPAVRPKPAPAAARRPAGQHRRAPHRGLRVRPGPAGTGLAGARRGGHRAGVRRPAAALVHRIRAARRAPPAC
jgi:ferredoxin